MAEKDFKATGLGPNSMASPIMLKTAKKELRTLIKQTLSKIPAESVKAQSDAIFKSVTSFKAYREAKRVGIYLSMPTGEVQTDAIVRHALESGKKVFVPYLHKAESPLLLVQIRLISGNTYLKTQQRKARV